MTARAVRKLTGHAVLAASEALAAEQGRPGSPQEREKERVPDGVRLELIAWALGRDS